MDRAPAATVTPTAPSPAPVSATVARARALAQSGDRVTAEKVCRQVLARDPRDQDAHLLLGQLFAWRRDYGSARRELNGVLRVAPRYTDARVALADTELWAHRPREALAAAEAGLAFEPRDAELLKRQAEAKQALKAEESSSMNPAANPGPTAVALDSPAGIPTRTVSPAIADAERPPLNGILLEYQHDALDQDFAAWDQVSLSYLRTFDFGPLIGRVTQANRFSLPGTLFEVDAYPRLREGTYFYLNAGYSISLIFPRYRASAEIYQALGKPWEISLGWRSLWFSTDHVTTYTASLSRYLGSFLISARPSFTPDTLGNAWTGEAGVKYYFTDETYLGLSGSSGSTIDKSLGVDQVAKLSVSTLGLNSRIALTRTFFVTGALVEAREEIRPAVFRHDLITTLGVEKRF